MQIRWLLAHPTSLLHRSQNAAPYIYYVVSQVKKMHLPIELALLPMIESNYDPQKTSEAHAAGLWQLMPMTARGLHLPMNQIYDGRRDIILSTTVALQYLKYLHMHLHHSWALALAAYNAGIGTVNRAIEYNLAHGKSTNFWELPLPQQTKAYLPKLIAIAIVLSHPERYKIPIKRIQNRPYLQQIVVPYPLCFDQLSYLTRVHKPHLLALNPGYINKKLPKQRHYRLLIPQYAWSTFKKNSAQYPNQSCRPIMVSKGDTLGAIAKRHAVSLRALMQRNHLANSIIHPGQYLNMPYCK